MNCEKCKNKKATLFYADENGGRHALCVSCGAKKDKSIPLTDASDTSAVKEEFIPTPTLSDIAVSPLPLSVDDDAGARCRGCASTLSEVRDAGELFCPECYSSFMDELFPVCILEEGSPWIKMPHRLTERANKKKLLSELKLQLRTAIEFEDFELAATLRDKIRSIESK